MKNLEAWHSAHKTMDSLRKAVAKEKADTPAWAHLSLARLVVGLKAEAVARGLA